MSLWGDQHGHPGCHGCQICWANLLEQVVLFLDIDGVLNSHRYMGVHPDAFSDEDGPEDLWELDPEACARLENLIQRTRAVLVVSSMWRKYHSAEELTRFLRLRGCPSAVVVGVTPDLAAPRGDEIHAYLKEHPEVSQFAIVDDDADLEPFFDKLVQTTMAEGLLDHHVEALVKLLL